MRINSEADLAHRKQFRLVGKVLMGISSTASLNNAMLSFESRFAIPNAFTAGMLIGGRASSDESAREKQTIDRN